MLKTILNFVSDHSIEIFFMTTVFVVMMVALLTNHCSDTFYDKSLSKDGPVSCTHGAKIKVMDNGFLCECK